MTYKQKAAALSALVLVLAAAYILSFVFDPVGNWSRGAAFAWLEPRFLDYADRIEIYASGGAVYGGAVNGGRTVLIRRGNVWFFITGNDDELPVKQARVEDFLAALTRKEFYQLRAVSLEARERLGLSESTASRIVIRGGAGLPLLDLFVGVSDALGREVHLRRADKNEIYSGEDRLTYFTENVNEFWLELRLFPPNNQRGRAIHDGAIYGGALRTDQIQQADVWLSIGFGATTEAKTIILRRSGNTWIIPNNESAQPDSSRVENWLRSVLEAEGIYIREQGTGNREQEAEAAITLWLGDGTSRVILVGPADDLNRRNATVTGSDYIYILSEGTISRIFISNEQLIMSR